MAYTRGVSQGRYSALSHPGFYRHVRNPMYVGFAVGWIGLWIVFGHASLLSIAAVAAVALGVHLFVILYEEPTLSRKFGTEYEVYCRNVSRSWPRLKVSDRCAGTLDRGTSP